MIQKSISLSANQIMFLSKWSDKSGLSFSELVRRLIDAGRMDPGKLSIIDEDDEGLELAVKFSETGAAIHFHVDPEELDTFYREYVRDQYRVTFNPYGHVGKCDIDIFLGLETSDDENDYQTYPLKTLVLEHLKIHSGSVTQEQINEFNGERNNIIEGLNEIIEMVKAFDCRKSE